MWPHTLAAAAFLAANISAAVHAQQIGPRLLTRNVPTASDDTTATLLVDIDSDGDLDVVFANSADPTGGLPPQNRLLRNDGWMRFTDVTATHLPVDDRLAWGAAAGDLDADGDVDLVFANRGWAWPSDLANDLYLNDGSGRFTASRGLPDDQDRSTSVAIGDVDGDGDLDVVVGNADYHAPAGLPNRVYLNRGDATFVAAPTALPQNDDPTLAVALADVDGDGDLDLACANDGPNRLYVNDGTGRFGEAPPASFPPGAASSTAIVLADCDGDGDLDMLVGNHGQNRFYSNDGHGAFTDRTPTALPVRDDLTTAAVATDIDEDGDLDIVSTGYVPGITPRSVNRVDVNDGTGVFTEMVGSPLPADPGAHRGKSVAAGDLDQDGDADLVIGNEGENQVLLGAGSGAFAPVRPPDLPAPSGYILSNAAGDVDGDGDLDVVIAYWFETVDRLFLNRGDGTFEDATDRLPQDSRRTRCVRLFDVDADGDPDLILGEYDAPIQLYLNDGTGRFTDATGTHMPIDPFDAVAIEFGDFDVDGDPDMLTGLNGAADRIMLNDGHGRFYPVAMLPPNAAPIERFVVGDVDGDGDDDILAGNSNAQNRLFVNDGGLFRDLTLTHLPQIADRTTDLALFDSDGDGDLDLFVVNRDAHLLYRNDGTGRFTDVSGTHLPAMAVGGTHVFARRFDGDAAVDLLVVGATSRLYLNRAGHFVDASSQLAFPFPAQMEPQSALSADLDSDGDADVIAETRVFPNLQRHLTSPWMPMTGAPWTLEVLAEPGYADRFRIAIPVVASAAARIELPPLGVLGLDPATTVDLPAMLLPAPAGRADVDLPVPSTAALIGRSVFAQALLLDPLEPAKLTNRIEARFWQ
jgi:hypothetical protein